ncbi:glycine oxidase ThiO [Oceanobacillus damuensis]|uniref:glycine oxidase ThiO n=1 Tax=Oceanobacillus damuensis TaxID=937928 RepID=UPI000831F0E8|nr:glycine oxidase ThiO [Oceanobacillus damuensis]
MKKHYDVIIVGGGVIGSSIAFYLSKRNYHVLVVEKEALAQKASRAAAGMLGAQNEIGENSPLLPFALKSRAMFPALAEELQFLSNINIELIQSGIIKVAQSEEEAAHLRAIASFQERLGEKAEWLTTMQVKEREPELSEVVQGGLYLPNDGQVSAPLLSKALAQSAAALGADFLEYTEVQELIQENNRISGVRTGTDIHLADHVVIAGGAWSKQILERTGISLETYPVKGECFSVNTHKRIITSSIFSSGGYIVPKSGGRLIIGATEKPDTFDESVQLDGLYSLMTQAVNIIPALKNAKWEKAWAGIRPQTGDGLPYLGEHPHVAGLFVATGHYRNGILLAPVTGLLMADMIDGKAGDHPFSINRIPYMKEANI